MTSTESRDPEDAPESNDFAMAAYLDDGVWQVAQLPRRAGEDLSSLLATLRRLPGEVGTIAMVSVDDDFFVAARVLGSQARLVLSDATAAAEWPLAREVLDSVRDWDTVGDVLDPEHREPIGDLDLFADLGFGAGELEDLCDDSELYPDEMCGEIADRLGFGREFDHMLDHVHDTALR